MLGIVARLRALLGRERGLFNLAIEPTWAIRASRTVPYFQALEQRARDAGFLGAFIVGPDGCLRPGSDPSLETRHATLALDVYPTPAAIEARSITDYDEPDAPRRQPRATLVLDDDRELLLWRDGDRLRVAGEPLAGARDEGPRR